MKRGRRRVTIEGLYYAHGLLCASYPASMLSFVFLVVVVCSLPFFVTPSGDLNTPKPWRSPWLNYRVPAGKGGGALGEGVEWIVDNSTQFSGRVPSWFRGLPVALAQQLYIDVQVDCSVHQSFCQKSHYSISRTVTAHLLNTLKNKTRSCNSVLHPAAVRLTSELDPSHPLGVLSPLLDSALPRWDSDQLVLGYQTTKELLYGGFWHNEHSSTPSPSTPSPPSPLTKSHLFSITLLLDASVPRFSSLTRCVDAIRGAWPAEGEATPLDARANFIKHFYYEPDWNLVEFLPLLSVYFIVFLYISFSVGKIDLVKSKVGLGVAAIVTLVCSLTMSLGICTFFGLSISLSSSEVYPFFVIVLGLENILIIVKAVMSTPEEFEVKQRVAAGLSKEGRAISRNLSTLLLMLSMGMVFFNYTMKEFCIIGLVALLCDAFLQLFFFPTVLSIDLRRLELSDLGPDPVRVAMQQVSEGTPATVATQGPCPTSLHISPPSRWRSKRVKFAYFLASARLVSRALMVGIVVSMLVVWAAQTETFQKLLGFNFVLPPPPTSLPINPPPSTPSTASLPPLQQDDATIPHQFEKNDFLSENGPTSKVFSNWDKVSNEVSELLKVGVAVWRGASDGWSVMCEAGEVCWRAMVTTHWPKLLEHYGYSTASRFLTVLPPITLTFDLGTDSARSSRGPAHDSHTHLYRMALFLTSHPYFTKGSVVCVFVCVVVVYCAWLLRSTLHRLAASGVQRGGGGGGKSHLRSSSLKGHTQDIECLCVSESHLVSVSLDGDIRVWNTDAMTRGCARIISRSEVCGDLAAYANKWRPDADGCEANTDNKSLLNLQIMHTSLPSSPVVLPSPSQLSPHSPRPCLVPATSQSSPPMSTSGPTSGRAGLSPLPFQGHPVIAGTNYQMTSSVTNQVAVSTVPHPSLGRSVSVQGEKDKQVLPQLHPLAHPHRTNGSVPPVPSSPSSPPPSPGVPIRKARRPSTHSLQEQVLRSQLEHRNSYVSNSASGDVSSSSLPPSPPPTITVPLCGLPTSPPPESAPVINSANSSRQRPQSASSAALPSPTRSAGVHVPVTTTRAATDHLPSTYLAAQTVQTAPLYSVSQQPLGHMSRRHTRSKSSGPFSAFSTAPPPVETKRRTHARHLSTGNIPQGALAASSNGRTLKDTPELSKSSVSLNSTFIFDSQVSQASPPNPEKGYDFAKHFNLFSPFTSNMALEYCRGEGTPELRESQAPAVWCMDVWSDSIAVGCGNGQIEAWNMSTGSLTFALSTNLPGATVVSITSRGIVSGHMDGCLHMVGLDGQNRRTLQAHRKPVSVLRCAGGRAVSGGYDGMVMVHRMADLEREAAVSIHNGSNITSLALDTTAATCVSGCGGGVVCHWELASGNCRHMLQERSVEEDAVGGVAVVKLEIAPSGEVVGLMSDETIVVWDKTSGESVYTIALEGVCQDSSVLGDRYIAACVESSIAVYDIESGQKRFVIPVEGGERHVVLPRHLLPLQGTHIACSTGRDIQILSCNVKLKVD